MGKRKREMAERQKAIKKQTAVAKLNNVPTSPRKMRYSADLIRGVEVNKALDILKFSKKEASQRLYKLLKSAIVNWETKNEENRKELDNGKVIIRTIEVAEGRTLKRLQTAPQGRAHRIRKRSNHVTIILDTKTAKEAAVEAKAAAKVAKANSVAEEKAAPKVEKEVKAAAKPAAKKAAPKAAKAPAKAAAKSTEKKPVAKKPAAKKAAPKKAAVKAEEK